MYLIRLDDASEYMDINNWGKIEILLDKYNIKPLVGVIPKNQDESLISVYKKDEKFWQKVKNWERKKWEIALHGYKHVYETKCGGLNPINLRSEFAGVSLERQKDKIREGINIFKKRNINTRVFFAPSHTFDKNTIIALREESNIRIISDTIANDIYKKNDFYYIPQQSGKVRNLNFKVTTFCYHPNEMNKKDFLELENFIKKNKEKFISFKKISLKNRKYSLYDKLLKFLYFSKRAIKNYKKGKKNG